MKKAELIFIPSPAIGHLLSILEFAKQLIDSDDRLLITVLCMKFPRAPFVDTYAKSVTASHPKIQLIDLPQVDPPSPESTERITRSPEYNFNLFVERNVPHVRNVVSSRLKSDSVRVTGLVLDFFCVPMIDVAGQLSLPSYIYLTSNAGFLALMLHLPTRHDQISTEFESSDPELLIPGFVNPVPACVLPSALFNKDGGYKTYVKLAQSFRDVNGIIVNTFSELESCAVNSFKGSVNPPVYTVGPVLHLDSRPKVNPDVEDAQRHRILRWLDDQPKSSVVFLCFGSLGRFSAAQVKEIAVGLERSGYSFLWSIRISPPKDEVCVQSTKHDAFPEGFLERIRGRGMICGWAPQVEILANKAIGGFVSHCGWNSILESLWYGVPIATWPMYAEQQINAYRMVKELGLAVEMRLDYRMGVDVVPANEIETTLGLVMDGDSEIRKRVKEMSEIGRKSLMDGGSSFISIRQFIDLHF